MKKKPPSSSPDLTVINDVTQISDQTLVTDETVVISPETEKTQFSPSDDATLVSAPPAEAGDAVAEASTFAPGHVVNRRFVIDKLLGVGGMGVVYRALDLRKQEAQDRDPYIAIKILGEDFKSFANAFVALQREARKSQALAHPNVITVYDFDRDGDVFYMTMEVLAGTPLDEFITRHPTGISAARARKIISGISKGLAYAHSKHIVHSDLKPGNIFILPDDGVKVLDFGIARAVTSVSEGDEAEADHTLFDAGELGGLTPAYASLEMFEGEEPHPSDDIYALGVISYEILTGSHPYGRKSAPKALAEKTKLQRIKAVKSHEWRAISGALALRRRDRTADAAQFLKQFEGLSAGVKLLSAVFVLVVAVLLTFIVLRPPSDGPEVPFEQLPVATQQQIQDLLANGHEAISFHDVNGALFYFNEAFMLHPGNQDANAGLNTVLATVLATLKAADKTPAELLEHINTLMNYPALANNALLRKEKDKASAVAGGAE